MKMERKLNEEKNRNLKREGAEYIKKRRRIQLSLIE